MLINWDKIIRAMYPIKDYEDLSSRFQASFKYPFVRETFNFSMAQLADYTRRLLEGDARGRYHEYATLLIDIINELDAAGIQNILELVEKVKTREQLRVFSEQSNIYAHNIVTVLKFLVYWLIPGEKYLSGLVQSDPLLKDEIKALRQAGVRTNLELLQKGITRAGREALAAASGLPEEVILELVNRADLSRMPWASKATISNIMGAGYCSLASLAGADPQALYDDFFRYGKAIGKNLKFGNEIESSHRIAKIVPVLLKDD